MKKTRRFIRGALASGMMIGAGSIILNKLPNTAGITSSFPTLTSFYPVAGMAAVTGDIMPKMKKLSQVRVRRRKK